VPAIKALGSLGLSGFGGDRRAPTALRVEGRQCAHSPTGMGDCHPMVGVFYLQRLPEQLDEQKRIFYHTRLCTSAYPV